MLGKWHRYHYKNFTYLLISLLIAFFLFKNPTFRYFLLHLGRLGYLGAFIAGFFYTSTFTISFATVLLLLLARYLPPAEMALVAGTGAVLGDFFIFQLIRSKGIVEEVNRFFNHFGGDKLHHLIHSKFFSWTLPVVGGIIIASPLPDELGISLMGISKMKNNQFIGVSFLLNFAGILIIVLSSRLFH